MEFKEGDRVWMRIEDDAGRLQGVERVEVDYLAGDTGYIAIKRHRALAHRESYRVRAPKHLLIADDGAADALLTVGMTYDDGKDHLERLRGAA